MPVVLGNFTVKSDRWGWKGWRDGIFLNVWTVCVYLLDIGTCLIVFVIKAAVAIKKTIVLKNGTRPNLDQGGALIKI